MLCEGSSDGLFIILHSNILTELVQAIDVLFTPRGLLHLMAQLFGALAHQGCHEKENHEAPDIAQIINTEGVGWCQKEKFEG